MASAIREIASDRRDQLVVLLQSYSRVGKLLSVFVERGLRRLGLDHADGLLLGWHNKLPSRADRRSSPARTETRDRGWSTRIRLPPGPSGATPC